MFLSFAKFLTGFFSYLQLHYLAANSVYERQSWATAEDFCESEEDDSPIGNTNEERSDEESGDEERDDEEGDNEEGGDDELDEEVEEEEEVMTVEQAEFIEQCKDDFLCNL